METAAEILIGRLHERLFLFREDIEEAVHFSRSCLLNNRKRRARFCQIVDLEDFTIPVSYQNMTIKVWKASITKTDQATRLREKDLTEEPPIPGRGSAILDSELRCSVVRLVQSYGARRNREDDPTAVLYLIVESYAMDTRGLVCRLLPASKSPL